MLKTQYQSPYRYWYFGEQKINAKLICKGFKRKRQTLVKHIKNNCVIEIESPKGRDIDINVDEIDNSEVKMK